MVDQKLVAIQHVLFLVFSLVIQLLDKVSSLVYFDYFYSQA